MLSQKDWVEDDMICENCFTFCFAPSETDAKMHFRKQKLGLCKNVLNGMPVKEDCFFNTIFVNLQILNKSSLNGVFLLVEKTSKKNQEHYYKIKIEAKIIFSQIKIEAKIIFSQIKF